MKRLKTVAKFVMGLAGPILINRELQDSAANSFLILVRHSIPAVDSTRAPSQWSLTEEGRAVCVPLAASLSVYQPTILFSSIEQKARETAGILAQQFDLQMNVREGLHEHERENEPYLDSPLEFRRKIQELFQSPNRLVYGSETSLQALSRYTQAVCSLVAEHPNQNIILVSHGTVMSLFIARYNPINGYEFWEKLRTPDCVVLSLPDFSLVHPKS